MASKPKPKKNRVSRQAAFLAAFAVTGRIAHAAKAAKIERDMHYRWMKDDPAYPDLFAEAKAKAAQAWEDEAVRRATEGVFEPTTHKGEFVYPVKYVRTAVINEETGLQERYPETVKNAAGEEVPHPEAGKLAFFMKRVVGKTPYGVMKLSDRLLEFLLRGAKPDTYRDRGQVEVTGAAGGPIEIVERLQAGRKRLAKSPQATDDGRKEE